jgi:hypothetical protein
MEMATTHSLRLPKGVAQMGLGKEPSRAAILPKPAMD